MEKDQCQTMCIQSVERRLFEQEIDITRYYINVTISCTIYDKEQAIDVHAGIVRSLLNKVDAYNCNYLINGSITEKEVRTNE